jgi:catechol 2,3-dioxygenase-like lactoylglutathione lyase family enzyme
MKSIRVISIPVTDQQRAKNFYLLLGFEIIDEAPMEGDKKWIRMGLRGDAVSITLVTWFREMPAGSMQGLVLGTDDIESDLQILRNNRVNISSVQQTPHGKFVSLKDPDGNGISLRQQ